MVQQTRLLSLPRCPFPAQHVFLARAVPCLLLYLRYVCFPDKRSLFLNLFSLDFLLRYLRTRLTLLGLLPLVLVLKPLLENLPQLLPQDAFDFVLMIDTALWHGLMFFLIDRLRHLSGFLHGGPGGWHRIGAHDGWGVQGGWIAGAITPRIAR